MKNICKYENKMFALCYQIDNNGKNRCNTYKGRFTFR